MKKIKIGVLGCSNIAQKSVIDAIKQCEAFELVYVASRDQEKGLAFAQRFGCRACSYMELIENKEVNAIYVSLPAALHYEWGLKVIRANKHLLLEKPFTDNIYKTKELIEQASQRGLIAMEGLMYLYHPLYKQVMGLIEDDAIGTVKHIEAYFGFPMLSDDDIRCKKELGGGAILDNLIYPLSICLKVARKQPARYSYQLNYNNKLGIDESGALLLDFEDISANVTYGFGFMYRNSYTIWGSKGYLMVDRAFSRPENFVGQIQIITQEGKQEVAVQADNQFKHMLQAFVNKIKRIDSDKGNEEMDIIERNTIISELYEVAVSTISGGKSK